MVKKSHDGDVSILENGVLDVWAYTFPDESTRYYFIISGPNSRRDLRIEKAMKEAGLDDFCTVYDFWKKKGLPKGSILVSPRVRSTWTLFWTGKFYRRWGFRNDDDGTVTPAY